MMFRISPESCSASSRNRVQLRPDSPIPVLLGDGIPLFPPGFPQCDLELIENKTYSKGLIALKYRRRSA
jgi:hypothetical protein